MFYANPKHPFKILQYSQWEKMNTVHHAIIYISGYLTKLVSYVPLQTLCQVTRQSNKLKNKIKYKWLTDLHPRSKQKYNRQLCFLITIIFSWESDYKGIDIMPLINWKKIYWSCCCCFFSFGTRGNYKTFILNNISGSYFKNFFSRMAHIKYFMMVCLITRSVMKKNWCQT